MSTNRTLERIITRYKARDHSRSKRRESDELEGIRQEAQKYLKEPDKQLEVEGFIDPTDLEARQYKFSSNNKLKNMKQIHVTLCKNLFSHHNFNPNIIGYERISKIDGLDNCEWNQNIERMINEKVLVKPKTLPKMRARTAIRTRGGNHGLGGGITKEIAQQTALSIRQGKYSPRHGIEQKLDGTPKELRTINLTSRIIPLKKELEFRASNIDKNQYFFKKVEKPSNTKDIPVYHTAARKINKRWEKMQERKEAERELDRHSSRHGNRLRIAISGRESRSLAQSKLDKLRNVKYGLSALDQINQNKNENRRYEGENEELNLDASSITSSVVPQSKLFIRSKSLAENAFHPIRSFDTNSKRGENRENREDVDNREHRENREDVENIENRINTLNRVNRINRENMNTIIRSKSGMLTQTEREPSPSQSSTTCRTINRSYSSLKQKTLPALKETKREPNIPKLIIKNINIQSKNSITVGRSRNIDGFKFPTAIDTTELGSPSINMFKHTPPMSQYYNYLKQHNISFLTNNNMKRTGVEQNNAQQFLSYSSMQETTGEAAPKVQNPQKSSIIGKNSLFHTYRENGVLGPVLKSPACQKYQVEFTKKKKSRLVERRFLDKNKVMLDKLMNMCEDRDPQKE